MLTIPSLLLKKLYTYGSLQNTNVGVVFSIKNRLSDAKISGLHKIGFNGKWVPLDKIKIVLDTGEALKIDDISASNPTDFPLRKSLSIIANIEPLSIGKHQIEVHFDTEPFGKLKLSVEGSISESTEHLVKIPRNNLDNFTDEIIQERQNFIESYTQKKVEHLRHYSFNPRTCRGNIENLTGVAQIPLGFAGPLLINGEHAQGEFLIPLATTEGTLVASYNRGIKFINLSGGVKCTVLADAMQRAPVFVFEDARQSRDFVQWVNKNIEKITYEAEATSSVARLQYIDPYLSNKFVYLRFNFSTGDAAGQNMVGRATFAACSWIMDIYPGIKHFFLESNFATDKKASHVNIMRTRGKRVVAEAVIKKDVLIQHARVEPESLTYHHGVANVGALLSGANNNGLHSANAIAAMFIATGQDVANVAESSAGIIYSELTPEKDLYLSITIPSLIVATYGGGTALATQKECLEILDAYGTGKVNKLAEIVAGVVLAGELSLAAAISSSDWVSSHEKYGRNR